MSSSDFQLQLDFIVSELKDIKKRLERIESSCEHMDEHIGFIGQVYEVVRTPFRRFLGGSPLPVQQMKMIKVDKIE